MKNISMIRFVRMDTSGVETYNFVKEVMSRGEVYKRKSKTDSHSFYYFRWTLKPLRRKSNGSG